MRLQPPKNWPHNEMNPQQMKDYILHHRIIGFKEEEITFLEFYYESIDKYKDKLECALDMVTLFPWQYEFEVFRVINEID